MEAVKDKLENAQAKELEIIIDIEHFGSICFRHLTSLIKNGRIKAEFMRSAEKAKANKEFLVGYLARLGVVDFRLEEKCRYCKINPESFSLIGAINVGLETTANAIKHYKTILLLLRDKNESQLFKGLLREKIEQRGFLIKERKYHNIEEQRLDVINNFCIPFIKSISNK